MPPQLSTGNFAFHVQYALRAETSADPEGWTETNPFYGQCAVVSLLAQDHFGGRLLRASLEDIPEFAHMRSHYSNVFFTPEREEYDFTIAQFGGKLPEGLPKEERERQALLSAPDTRRRYELLAWQFANVLATR